MIDIPTPKLITLPEAINKIGYSLFSPDGTMLAAVYTDGVVRVFAWPSLELLFDESCSKLKGHTGEKGPAKLNVCWSVSPQRLYYISSGNHRKPMNCIQEVIFDQTWYRRRAQVRDIYEDYGITKIAVNRMGTRIYLIKPKSTCNIVTLAVGKTRARVIAQTATNGHTRHIACGPDIQALCAERNIMLWPEEDDHPHVLHTENSAANDVAFSGDGQMLVAAFENGTIYVRNMKEKTHITDALIGEQTDEKHKIRVALSHNGSLLATNIRGTLFILNSSDLNILVEYKANLERAQMGRIDHPQFSPCARYLNTGQGIVLDFGGPNIGRKHPIMRLFQS